VSYTDSFDFAVKIILEEEGGFVNNAKDPGGETKYGISKRQYPDVDIINLTEEQAIDIYHQDYWNPVSGDDLPKPLALCVFDCAVNQGVGAAIRLLQSSLGATVDGVIGPQTRTLIRQKPGKRLINDFMAWRGVKYAGTRNFDAFGHGWMKRLMRVHYAATKITGD